MRAVLPGTVATVATILVTSVPSVLGQARPLAQERAAAADLFVSEHSGNDTAGDGTADKPFATIRRALALQAKLPAPDAVIHLGIGHYGADKGESFPIRLPAGVRLVGFGSNTCEIVGSAELPVVELPVAGAVALESVVLRGGAAGITAIAGDAYAATDAAPLRIALIDVAIEGCTKGVDLAPARGRIELRGDGLRVRKATAGLAAAGAATLALVLERCEFVECGEGVSLSTERAGPDGPDHSVTVRRCRFVGNTDAGLVRHGKDGRNLASEPWRIESSLFQGSAIGLSLEIPGGDVPFVVRDCDFLENEIFGLAIVGSGAAFPGASRIEGCRLRWNGVGAQILTMGRTLELAETRFEDSVGAGLSFGNFVGERSALRAARCLFAKNGAAGLFGLCERENGIDVALDRCTIVDNRGSGIEKRNRKRGSGPWLLTRCIVAGHEHDLVKLEAAEARDCLIGGDPRFVDRAARDWRLASDSPARTADGPLGAIDAPADAKSPARRP